MTLFISLFFIAYFYLLKQPAYPTSMMPLTFLDRLIGFQPTIPLFVDLCFPSPGLAGDATGVIWLCPIHGWHLPCGVAGILRLAHSYACGGH